MSDYDRNLRGPGYRTNPRWSGSGSWITGAVIVVLLLIGIGYVFSNHNAANAPLVEHRAAATDTNTPATAPVKPMTTPSAAPTPAPTSTTAPKP